MIAFRAKRRFKTRYLIGLLKGMSSEQAADYAMTVVKRQMLELLSKDATLSPFGREDLWARIQRELFDWQILLINIPIDKARIPDITSSIKQFGEDGLEPEDMALIQKDEVKKLGGQAGGVPKANSD